MSPTTPGSLTRSYVRLKLASVRAFGAELIVRLRGVPAHSPLSRVVSAIIDAWALRKGIVYERADSTALEFEAQNGGELPAWVKYLLAFDVKYRERRLHFLIEGQNRLYQLLGRRALRRARIPRWSITSNASSTAGSTCCYGARARISTAATPASWCRTSSRPPHRWRRCGSSIAYAADFVERNGEKLDR